MNIGKRWTVFALVAGALAMALAAAACGGGAKASTVRVVVQEWIFQPTVASVRAGTVTFEVVNEDKVDEGAAMCCCATSPATINLAWPQALT